MSRGRIELENLAVPYPKLDASRLQVFPLSERRNLLDFAAGAADPDAEPPPVSDAIAEQIDRVAERFRAARQAGASTMLTYGAHLVKNYAAPLVRWLIEQKSLTHLATQGAGVIHDWEFAYQGHSGESVRENAPAGRFGAWDETGFALNLAAVAGAAEGLGLGEAVGRFIVDDGWELPAAEVLIEQIRHAPEHALTPGMADLLQIMQRFELGGGRVEMHHRYKDSSILVAAHAAGVPLTVHPGIGYDIIVNHPMYDGAAIGRAAETDARVFAQSVDGLDGGVHLSVGSAIMSPQVFEKAFSAANNLRASEGRPMLSGHTLVIVDIQDGGGWDWSQGEPPPENPAYYLRYCKSFYRMGGELIYIQCDNRVFLAHLIARLRET
jgi:hypothetical protein